MTQIIGHISRQGTFVDGSHRMEAWCDRFLTAHDIRYQGELTEDVCKRIVNAYNERQRREFKRDCYPSLRTVERPEAIDVDVDSRKLLVENTTSLWD